MVVLVDVVYLVVDEGVVYMLRRAGNRIRPPRRELRALNELANRATPRRNRSITELGMRKDEVDE